jgi:hypothetical protein
MPFRSALQINIHPLDVHHVTFTLEHQLRQWSGQVERVLLTIDTRRSWAGRYRGYQYDESLRSLVGHIDRLRSRYADLQMAVVDYSEDAREAVRRRFFSAERECPEKAFDGGPFHAYFYGLLKAEADYVLHMDSDMLSGGGSQTWMAEAIAILETNPSALFAGPLPGPPRADGELNDMHRSFPGLKNVPRPERMNYPFPAFKFVSVSTRIFLMSLPRFDQRVGSLSLVRPDAKQQLRAKLYRQAPLSMPAEQVLTAAMIERNLCRIDFFGSGAGMFSLHPPYRSTEFYRSLPALIERIERADVPDAQRGDYNVNGSMIDWTSALREKTRLKRFVRGLDHLVRVNLGR